MNALETEHSNLEIDSKLNRQPVKLCSYKFKFFIHFLLEIFPRNLLRSSMDS